MVSQTDCLALSLTNRAVVSQLKQHDEQQNLRLQLIKNTIRPFLGKVTSHVPQSFEPIVFTTIDVLTVNIMLQSL